VGPLEWDPREMELELMEPLNPQIIEMVKTQIGLVKNGDTAKNKMDPFSPPTYLKAW